MNWSQWFLGIVSSFTAGLLIAAILGTYTAATSFTELSGKVAALTVTVDRNHAETMKVVEDHEMRMRGLERAVVVLEKDVLPGLPH